MGGSLFPRLSIKARQAHSEYGELAANTPVFFEDFEIGASRASNARTISEADIVFHAGHSGDFMPHHTDAEFCKTQSFKKIVAHGNMTFAIAIGLSVSSQPLNPHGMSYGYNKIRYPRPVLQWTQ